MGCCNEPVTTLAGLPADPSQHVNYERGMVLGVDDFRQEFAYLSGRDHWLARDAIGYGTLSGLRVLFENDGSEGPRLHVGAGTALVPSGKLICVPADQCAVINRWLARTENAALVNRLLNPTSPPMSPPVSPPMPPAVASGEISLYLTLCYADCQTRPVPIPGEPCRSEDELMKPSRIADDYRLVLRETAPAQVEEDALRDFVRWLRANITVVDTSPPSPADPEGWLAALRNAVQPWADAQALSPPLSPPASFTSLGDYLFDLGSPTLAIGREQQCEFLRTAFRFWVTELRPMWMAMRCHRAEHADLDCVLLARVSFDVSWIGGSPTGAWQITGSPTTVRIDESTRPVLAHQRLLQEWALCGCDCAGGAGASTAFGGGGGEFAPLMGLARRRTPLLSTGADLTLDETHEIVIARGTTALTLTLPVSSPATAGRTYTVRNIDVDTLTVKANGRVRRVIDGKPSLLLSKEAAVTLVADGEGQWHTIAKA